jgi:hypothetical protein
MGSARKQAASEALMPRKRGGEDLSAAVNDKQFVAGARQLSNLPRDRLNGFFALEQRACNFDNQSHSKPAVSG